MKRYVYFVVYRSTTHTGDIEVFMAEPITHYCQIRDIGQGLKEREGFSAIPVITNFILLREDDEGLEDSMIFMKDCDGHP